ncbi:MAG: hypothetical protein HKM95_03090 [Inquilinus sp.]|nr:hypothetical protein [Inquilinus sp.]
MKTPEPVAFLDRPAARLVAVGCAVLCAVALAYIHRDDLLGSDEATAANDPVAACLAERAADIDRMVADGVVDTDRATLFKSRAEALCQATVGGGSGPPLPGQ